MEREAERERMIFVEEFLTLGDLGDPVGLACAREGRRGSRTVGINSLGLAEGIESSGLGGGATPGVAGCDDALCTSGGTLGEERRGKAVADERAFMAVWPRSSRDGQQRKCGTVVGDDVRGRRIYRHPRSPSLPERTSH